jgi:hypothetical protein
MFAAPRVLLPNRNYLVYWSNPLTIMPALSIRVLLITPSVVIQNIRFSLVANRYLDFSITIP